MQPLCHLSAMICNEANAMTLPRSFADGYVIASVGPDILSGRAYRMLSLSL